MTSDSAVIDLRPQPVFSSLRSLAFFARSDSWHCRIKLSTRQLLTCLQIPSAVINKNTVFGKLSEHCFQAKESPFFYRSWKKSYRHFDNNIKKAYESGNSFVADFDLVSFYGLIDHRLLRQLLERRIQSPKMLDLLFCCLEKWTENEWGTWLHHGIPQGPEPSAFLAECVLLDFDKLRFKGVVYLRYLDDIKLMANDELPVRKALLAIRQSLTSIFKFKRIAFFDKRHGHTCAAFLPRIPLPAQAEFSRSTSGSGSRL